MTKILFIITQGEMGGAQRYVLDLTKNLDKSAYQILVVMGEEKTELRNRLREFNIPVKLAKHLKRNIHPLHDLLAIWELKKMIKEFRPDIVHLNSSKAGILGSLAARLAGVKNVIFTAHGFAFLEPHGWLVRQSYFWAEKLATYCRKMIITVSDFDRETAIKSKIGRAEKFQTIHNGIDLSISNHHNPSPPPLTLRGGVLASRQGKPPLKIRPACGTGREDEKELFIGTIANLYPAKGLQYLIEAARLVPHAQFVVIGEGQERKNLELQIKKYGLENRFFLTGAIPEAQELLPAFDVYVISSLKEGFPYTLLEAMRAGLAIVATSVGGIPEAISPSLFLPLPSTKGEGKGEIERGLNATGILVEPKNPQALAQAIITLLQNPELKKTLGANARERVKNFSIAKMLEATAAVYRELMV